MKKTRGFTLIELLVVIAIIALLIGILVPALGAARRAANKMKNGTQGTAVGKSLVLWSDAFYQQSQDFPKPGLVPKPSSFTAGFTVLDTAGTNLGPEFRIAALLNMGSDVLAPQMLINPVGTDTQGSGTVGTIVLSCSMNVGTLNQMSYALLQAADGEWKNKVNASAPIICDRQVGGIGTNKSFWNTANWEGDVTWGDTHVTWETMQSWPATTMSGNSTTHDDLFDNTANTARMINPTGAL